MSTDSTPAAPIVPVVYRVEEAAQALRISRCTAYELIRSGELRSVKIGARRLIPVAAVTEYIETLRSAA
ncbi:hypothetical protein GCM10028784_36560 [Myceligenerans cantabricum]